MSKKSTSNIDIAIGAKIKSLRTASGMTMQRFAYQIGVTQQQAHKYEKGTNRISASRLLFIAEVLSVPVSYFFTGYSDIEEKNYTSQRKNMDLLKSFQAIRNIRHQDAVSNLVRMLAEE